YTNPREKILGSVAWGGAAEGIVFIEPEDPEDVGGPRKLWLLPRNAPGKILTLGFKDGLLVETKTTVKPTNRETLAQWLVAVPQNNHAIKVFTWAQALSGAGLAERSLRFK